MGKKKNLKAMKAARVPYEFTLTGEIKAELSEEEFDELGAMLERIMPGAFDNIREWGFNLEVTGVTTNFGQVDCHETREQGNGNQE